MKDIERRNGLYEALAWSGLFLWMGIASLVPDLPAGAGLFGVGGILLVSGGIQAPMAPFGREYSLFEGTAIALDPR